MHGQVLPREVLLLSGSTRVQQLQLKDFGLAGKDTIVTACTADPYLLLKSSSGAAFLFIADESDGEMPTPLQEHRSELFIFRLSRTPEKEFATYTLNI